MRWGRRFLLGALLAALFALAVGEGQLANNAIYEFGKQVVAGLTADPMAVLDKRSPRRRRAGPFSFTKSKPHERVLATVRDRLKPIAISPSLEIQIPAGTFAPSGGSPVAKLDIPPGFFASDGQGAPHHSGFSEDIPFEGAGGQPLLPAILAGNTPPPATVTAPGGSAGPQSTQSAGGPALQGGGLPQSSSPGEPPGSSVPPPGSGSSPTPDTPPGGSPPGGSSGQPSPPGTLVVSEPSSSTILIVGLIAVGLGRRRLRKRRV